MSIGRQVAAAGIEAAGRQVRSDGCGHSSPPAPPSARLPPSLHVALTQVPRLCGVPRVPGVAARRAWPGGCRVGCARGLLGPPVASRGQGAGLGWGEELGVASCRCGGSGEGARGQETIPQPVLGPPGWVEPWKQVGRELVFLLAFHNGLSSLGRDPNWRGLARSGSCVWFTTDRPPISGVWSVPGGSPWGGGAGRKATPPFPHLQLPPGVLVLGGT